MAHRATVAFTCGIIALCGIGCMAATFISAPFVNESFQRGCEIVTTQIPVCAQQAVQEQCSSECSANFDPNTGEYAQCYAQCTVEANNQEDIARITDINQDKCQRDLKVELGCSCSGETVDTCDCGGVFIGELERAWIVACYTAGSLGFAICWFIAICGMFAAYADVKACNVTVYSALCAVFFILFLIVGALGLTAAALIKGPGPIQDQLSQCTTTVSASVDLSASDPQAAQQAVDCALESVCSTVNLIADDLFPRALAIGILYAIAGLAMMVGNYACCCCKRDLKSNTGY